jgi:hypothetical protein
LNSSLGAPWKRKVLSAHFAGLQQFERSQTPTLGGQYVSPSTIVYMFHMIKQ